MDSPEQTRFADYARKQSVVAIDRGASISAPPRQTIRRRSMRESESAGAHGVNAQGIQIAARVEELHCSALNLTRDTALTEDGALVADTVRHPHGQ